MISPLARGLVLCLAVLLMAACSAPTQSPTPAETDGDGPRETATEVATAEPTDAETPEETTEATPDGTDGATGEVVFSDDFSDPASGWFEGDATFEDSFENGILEGEYTDDGTLRLTAQVTAGSHTVVGAVSSTSVDDGALQDLADVSMEVDVTVVERREVATAGLVCRQNVEEGTFYTAYLLIEPGFPMDARIARSDAWDKDVQQLDVSDALLEEVDEATGTTFHLALDCIGDTITMSVDGEVVAEATDATYAEGGVGFEYVSFISKGVAEEGAEPRLVLEYDDFEVREGASAD